MGSNCTFEHDVPGIGYLESSSSSPDMKAGARPQLPVWPAEMLAVSQWLSTLSDVITHQSRSPPASGTPSRRIRGRWNYAVWRRITTGWERGFWGCPRIEVLCGVFINVCANSTGSYWGRSWDG